MKIKPCPCYQHKERENTMETDFGNSETIEQIRKNLAGKEKGVDYETVKNVFDQDPYMSSGIRVDAFLEAILPMPEEEPEDPGMVNIDRVIDYVVECRKVFIAVAAALLDMFEIDRRQTDALETIKKVKDLIVESGIFKILPKQRRVA